MTRYDDFPDHPLCGVPADVLEAARGALREGAKAHDVNPQQADPLADSALANAIPQIRKWLETKPLPVTQDIMLIVVAHDTVMTASALADWVVTHLPVAKREVMFIDGETGRKVIVTSHHLSPRPPF